MANEIWRREEQKFLQAIQDVIIPGLTLNDVEFIVPKTSKDFEEIPNGGGCYWIWTNEPVMHTMHKNRTPDTFDQGEIIYNGIAKDNVKGRVRHHLLGDLHAGWSGISMDIYFGKTVSHRKKAFSAEGKVPYLKEGMNIFKQIRTKNDLFNLFLSEGETKILKEKELDTIYFRNGIDIREEKHINYDFRIYFITGIYSLYLEYIEKKWRENFGVPKLCSYLSGR